MKLVAILSPLVANIPLNNGFVTVPTPANSFAASKNNLHGSGSSSATKFLPHHPLHDAQLRFTPLQSSTMQTLEGIEYNDMERLNIEAPKEAIDKSIAKKLQKTKSSTTTKTTSARNSFDKKEDKNEKSKVRASVKETGSETMRYYMKSMGNHELLGKNEEQILGKQIQMLIKWEGIREELEAELMR